MIEVPDVDLPLSGQKRLFASPSLYSSKCVMSAVVFPWISSSEIVTGFFLQVQNISVLSIAQPAPRCRLSRRSGTPEKSPLLAGGSSPGGVERLLFCFLRR